MSEYQRYEFMTIDRPLTRAQLDAVNGLSSHIEASSTHALIEYHWGDFKHDPIKVLHKYFDGFLYWANWGAPQLALRFPHGTLPADLLAGYDFENFVTLTLHADYDILDISFGEMEGPDEWTEYDLGSLIPIRDELIEGDLRALYITWLATQIMIEGYDEEVEEEDYDVTVPPVPPAFDKLTAAQQTLAELLQVPQDLLAAAARHSKAAVPSASDDFAAWVKLLLPDRQLDYLVRLAHNESGLSRLLVKELRMLGQGKANTPPMGEHVTYATLLAESKAIRKLLLQEKYEREKQAHEHHLKTMHDHQDTYWRQVELAATRASGPGYDEAVRLLVELREVAEHFNETAKFQARFRVWVLPLLRRPALLKRLQDQKFTLPTT